MRIMTTFLFGSLIFMQAGFAIDGLKPLSVDKRLENQSAQIEIIRNRINELSKTVDALVKVLDVKDEVTREKTAALKDNSRPERDNSSNDK